VSREREGRVREGRLSREKEGRVGREGGWRKRERVTPSSLSLHAAIVGSQYIKLLETSKPKLKWDSHCAEHHFQYKYVRV
jgi:hypothetical protein